MHTLVHTPGGPWIADSPLGTFAMTCSKDPARPEAPVASGAAFT